MVLESVLGENRFEVQVQILSGLLQGTVQCLLAKGQRDFRELIQPTLMSQGSTSCLYIFPKTAASLCTNFGQEHFWSMSVINTILVALSFLFTFSPSLTPCCKFFFPINLIVSINILHAHSQCLFSGCGSLLILISQQQKSIV